MGLTTLSKVQPPCVGYAVSSAKTGSVCLAVCAPATACDAAGSVQMVMMSSAAPVMPGCDSQVRARDALPEATMAVLGEQKEFSIERGFASR